MQDKSRFQGVNFFGNIHWFLLVSLSPSFRTHPWSTWSACSSIVDAVLVWAQLSLSWLLLHWKLESNMNGYSRNAAEIHNFGGIFIACFVVVVYVCVCVCVFVFVFVCVVGFWLRGKQNLRLFPEDILRPQVFFMKEVDGEIYKFVFSFLVS